MGESNLGKGISVYNDSGMKWLNASNPVRYAQGNAFCGRRDWEKR